MSPLFLFGFEALFSRLHFSGAISQKSLSDRDRLLTGYANSMNDAQKRTVSASYMATLLDAFVHAGCARDFLLSRSGLDETALSDPDSRLPVETVTRAWQAATEKSTDGLIGLRVGKHIRPGSFSVLGHLLMTCATLRDALDKASRFAPLVGDGGRLAVEFTKEGAVLSYDLIEGTIPCRAERVEAIVASLIGFSRWITGQEILPKAVSFTHAPLAETTAYEAFFLIKPRFTAPENTIVIDQEDLVLPLQQANPELSDILGGHAEKVLHRVTSLSPFLRDLHQALKDGASDLDAAASTLGITPRSLQRKLAELGTSFQEQLGELRRDRAMEHLKNGDKSIAEISYLLGFSDTASFSRAFKRWTGLPPGKWLDSL